MVKNFKDMFSCLDTIPACDRRIDAVGRQRPAVVCRALLGKNRVQYGNSHMVRVVFPGVNYTPLLRRQGPTPHVFLHLLCITHSITCCNLIVGDQSISEEIFLQGRPCSSQ